MGMPNFYKIVFLFYETEKSELTTNHLIYAEGAAAKAYELWKSQKTGFLSTFPFGAFAYARLDERLAKSSLWNTAERTPGHDPMGQTPKQPHIELFNSECYIGAPQLSNQMPLDRDRCFSMIVELFSPRSKGTVTLKSADPAENPVVDHKYLSDPLDLLVLSEGCRLGNEVVTKGSGTRDIFKGSWPPEHTAHHLYNTQDEWEAFVKEKATTCKILLSPLLPPGPLIFLLQSVPLTVPQATIPPGPAAWASPTSPSPSSTPSSACTARATCASSTSASCPSCTAATRRCPRTGSARKRRI